MLLAINERIKGWLGIFIVILIGLPFALWGIQSYVGGADEQFAAHVDDREITARELDSDVSRIRQQIARDETRELPSDEELRRQAIQRMVNTTVLENQAEAQGYEISDPVLAAGIRELFSHEGQFMAEQYQQVLRSQGMTPAMFERRYRSELRVKQLRDAILNSAIVSVADARRLVELSEQVRDIDWLRLNVDKLVGDIEISDADVQAYYDKNAARFMTPAQVSIEYVELSGDTVTGIDIDEASVQARYDDYVVQQQQREERRARHILITTTDTGAAEARQKIEDIRSRLDDGEDFAELAKQYSEDPGSAQAGGDLDWIGIGQMVEPFEDALFELEQGEVSDVVETEFGYHLILVDELRSAEVADFASMEAELREQVRRVALDSMMYDLSEIMANTAYESPDSLEPVAEALELEIQTTDSFSRAFGTGIADNEAVRMAAFSSIVLERGENSELIELAPDHVLVLRVKDHSPAAPVPLESVRSTIEAAIRVAEGQQRAGEIADELIAELEAGASIDSLLRKGIENEGNHKVSQDTADRFDRYFVEHVLSMPLPEGDEKIYDRINLGSGDVAVIIQNAVEFPEEIDDARLQRTVAQLRRARAIEDFGVMLSAYKDAANIEINEKVITRE